VQVTDLAVFGEIDFGQLKGSGSGFFSGHGVRWYRAAIEERAIQPRKKSRKEKLACSVRLSLLVGAHPVGDQVWHTPE
jgi:hypothetical protein